MNIPEAIRVEQARKKLTNIKICKDLGINPTNYSSFLHGKRTIPLRDLERLLQYLGLEVQRKRPEEPVIITEKDLYTYGKSN